MKDHDVSPNDILLVIHIKGATSIVTNRVCSVFWSPDGLPSTTANVRNVVAMAYLDLLQIQAMILRLLKRN